MGIEMGMGLESSAVGGNKTFLIEIPAPSELWAPLFSEFFLEFSSEKMLFFILLR